MTGQQQLCFSSLTGSKLQAFLTRYPTAADSVKFRCKHCRDLFNTEAEFSGHCEAVHVLEPGYDEGLVEERLRQKLFMCHMCTPTAAFHSTCARAAHQHAIHRRMLQGI